MQIDRTFINEIESVTHSQTRRARPLSIAGKKLQLSGLKKKHVKHFENGSRKCGN